MVSPYALEDLLGVPPEEVHTDRLYAALDRLGRLKERFWRASQAFDVTVRKLPQPIGKQHLEVSWVRNEKFHEWSQLVDGCYLLRTNLTGVDPATLWRRYIQLTEAEWAFRIAKDELAIRPVWHQKEDRRGRAEDAAPAARAATSQATQAARQHRANGVKTLTLNSSKSRALRSQVRKLG